VCTGGAGVVDERAVLAAAKTRALAGAGLDSIIRGPLHTRSLSARQALVVTPGIGACTREAMARETRRADENLLCVLSGTMLSVGGRRPAREGGRTR
jgi:phosphoglycerate dehydrogenase-like enzyme